MPVMFVENVLPIHLEDTYSTRNGSETKEKKNFKYEL